MTGLTHSDVTTNTQIYSAHFSKRGLWQFHLKVPDIFPWRQFSSAPSSSQELKGSESIPSSPELPSHQHHYLHQRHNHHHPGKLSYMYFMFSVTPLTNMHAPIVTPSWSLLSDNIESVSLSTIQLLTTHTIGNQTQFFTLVLKTSLRYLFR